VGVWWVLRLAERRAWSGSAIRCAAAICVVAAGMIALTISWRLVGRPPPTPTTSQLHLLDVYDRARLPLGATDSPLRLLSLDQVMRRILLHTDDRRGSPPRGTLVLLPETPAGVYRVLLEPAPGRRPEGRVEVHIGRRSAIGGWTLDASQWPPPSLDITVPISVNSLWVTGDASVMASVRSAALAALAPTTRGDRVSDRPAMCGARYGAVTIYSAISCADIEPAGFWVRASGGAEIVVQPAADTSTITMALRNIAAPNEITIASGEARRTVRLGPDEQTIVALPSAGPGAPAILEFTATNGLRPADVDATSTDRRLLGCWVEIR
jgi:hypothetical protein